MIQLDSVSVMGANIIIGISRVMKYDCAHDSLPAAFLCSYCISAKVAFESMYCKIYM